MTHKRQPSPSNNKTVTKTTMRLGPMTAEVAFTEDASDKRLVANVQSPYAGISRYAVATFEVEVHLFDDDVPRVQANHLRRDALTRDELRFVDALCNFTLDEFAFRFRTEGIDG